MIDTGDSPKQRFIFGLLGVLASLVFLAASGLMNFRFGYTLGRTELDSQIYGAISAAADCFKALCPFFFFAAWRSSPKHWSMMVASALVWFIVVGYALAGAAGHAGANRSDTTGARALAVDHYKDLRADLERYNKDRKWIPEHRPADTVKGEIESLRSKNMRLWNYSEECVRPDGAGQRNFCGEYHKLRGELGNAESAAKLNTKIDEISAKLAETKGGAAVGDADPQASTISRILVFLGVNLAVADTQTWLTIFVVLLIEDGSTFGLYISVQYARGSGTVSDPNIIDADYKNVPPSPLVTEPARDTALGLPPPFQPGTGQQIIAPELPAIEPAAGSPYHVARLPVPGSLPSLEAIGFPLHERPAKRRDKSQPREAAERYATWLRAFDLVREPLTDEDVTGLYAEFCEADYRQPTAENLMRGELKNLKGVNWSKPRTEGDDGKVKRQTRWMITRGRYPPPTPQKEGVILAYRSPLAVPAREPEPDVDGIDTFSECVDEIAERRHETMRRAA